ncbi:MAG: glycosyltransferase [Bacteroidia bacterium]|nr:glycosyltransferase [Bacteroidia bacterium]
MPKVLRIINRFNLGGISYNVSYLSRYMPQECDTLLIGGPEEEGEESSLYIPHSLGLKPVVIEEMRRSINPFSDYFAYRRIKKIIREFKPDIVHTHASKAGAIGRMAAIHCGVPVIVHTFHGHVFQGYFGSFKTNIFKFIERYLAKRSSAIVAISQIQKKELSETYSICEAAKIEVVPLGFDLDRFTENQAEKRKNFRSKYGLQEDELAIGIIGRLAPIKNHYLFIDAIEQLSKSTNKKIKALIIGDGETKQELMAYLQQKQLPYSTDNTKPELFILTSWIREVDIALAGLDLVCLTSKNEGTPVSLIEAQAASRYIVTTNVGGIKDILHPDCGLLSAPDDKDTYIKNLIYAVTHFEEVHKKAGSASVEVVQKFSYKRLCSDMWRLYQKLGEKIK